MKMPKMAEVDFMSSPVVISSGYNIVNDKTRMDTS